MDREYDPMRRGLLAYMPYVPRFAPIQARAMPVGSHRPPVEEPVDFSTIGAGLSLLPRQKPQNPPAQELMQGPVVTPYGLQQGPQQAQQAWNLAQAYAPWMNDPNLLMTGLLGGAS